MLKRVNNFGVTYEIRKSMKEMQNVKGIKSRKRQYETERYQHNN